MTLSTHRIIQINALFDTAGYKRVQCYCNAIKAAQISNNAAARYFTKRAQQWHSIEKRCRNRLYGDPLWVSANTVAPASRGCQSVGSESD